MEKTSDEVAPRPSTRLGWARQAFGGLLQLAVVMLFWLAGLGVASLFGWPQLAGVVGMAAMWLALQRGWLRVEQVRIGAGWLLTHMLLFFVPAVLVVLDHRELLGWVGIKLVAVIVIGTVVVMASTALTIEWFLRWSRRRQALARLQQSEVMRHVA